MPPLKWRWEKACLNLTKGMTATDAFINAGFAPKWAATHTTRWLKSAKIQTRLAELQARLIDTEISTEKERRKILTQIQRATIADFVDEYGNLNIKNKAQLQTSAVQEIKTERTPVGIRTTLKLRDPVGAIAEHNKMEHIYDERPQFNDNRVINFIVTGDKKLIEGISRRLLVQGQREAEGSDKGEGEALQG